MAKKKIARKRAPRKKRGPLASDEFATKSSYLKGTDIKKPFIATVASIEKVEFDDGPKWVIGLEEMDKSIVLNKTNGSNLGADLGNDMYSWIGQKIYVSTERRRNPQTGKNVQAPAVCGITEDSEEEVDDLPDFEDSDLE